MEHKKLILPGALFMLFIISLVIFFGSQGKEKTLETIPDNVLEKDFIEAKKNEPETKNVVLFFVSEENHLLHKEEREIAPGLPLEDQIKGLIEELIAGSEEGLLSPVPPETKIRGVYIIRDGTVYIDFSEEFQTGHPSGSAAEISSIFSVVNSITYNFKSISRVFILVNGTEQETLDGHIDLRRPFLPRYDLIND